MNVSLHDVHQALVQLSRLRFGEMNIEQALREATSLEMVYEMATSRPVSI